MWDAFLVRQRLLMLTFSRDSHVNCCAVPRTEYDLFISKRAVEPTCYHLNLTANIRSKNRYISVQSSLRYNLRPDA
jgi:hypothetical protein